MKLLLWAAIGFIVVMWLLRSNKVSSTGHASGTSSTSKKDKLIEPMVQCAHCGVYIPASESVTAASGKVFCSDEHRLKHVGP
ncbi:PP0621 family protein [Herbaspirillum sp. ST 5-3]|uniref:PP0621 family protein n=1 Tax=Oxalobacteraceae TaxID=75682 RepID=UPI0010A33133|nr:PP0621 family protein [Herbaspirillum sp. ST 5-3]